MAQKFMVAREDETGRIRGYLDTTTTDEPRWPHSAERADLMTEEEARESADRWNDYASVRGYTVRFAAIPTTGGDQ